MSNQQRSGRSGLVFGARNLGGAIIDTLVADGWAMAGVARSTGTLEKITHAGALALEADVTDQASVTRALDQAAEANGRIDLVVNAASTYGGARTGPFGGGPIAEASADAFDSWATAPPRAAFAFLSGAGSFLAAQGGLATVIQVTGGSARRAMPGRGLWAAGAFGVRAITQAAALELRARGIHVALLIVDAGIQPVSGPPRPGVAPETLADASEIADAVRFLASQGTQAATHELQVTPLAETWVP
jgi:NADP-dependent 3-hydroxy acid dehydrogenase YdfG